jgi:hypothetical protein
LNIPTPLCPELFHRLPGHPRDEFLP